MPMALPLYYGTNVGRHVNFRMITPLCATAQNTRVVGPKVKTQAVINSQAPLRRVVRPTLRRKIMMNQVPNDINKANLPPPVTSGVGANRRGKKIGNHPALITGKRTSHCQQEQTTGNQ